jgi:hypothetical protein
MGEGAGQFNKVARQKVNNRTDSMHQRLNRGEAWPPMSADNALLDAESVAKRETTQNCIACNIIHK